MKAEWKKPILLIMIIIISAAITIMGFTVSAADHAATTSTNASSINEEALPPLKDGVWQALYEDGSCKLLYIDTASRSLMLVSTETGVDLPCRYSYESDSGIYKLQIGSEGKEENWRIIDNDGKTAAVSNAKGDFIALYYLSNDADNFGWYALNDLTEMARGCYEAHQGDSKDVKFTAAIQNDGSFFAVITGTKDGAKVATYTVDMTTATGTDSNHNAVDLNLYFPD